MTPISENILCKIIEHINQGLIICAATLQHDTETLDKEEETSKLTTNFQSPTDTHAKEKASKTSNRSKAKYKIESLINETKLYGTSPSWTSIKLQSINFAQPQPNMSSEGFRLGRNFNKSPLSH